MATTYTKENQNTTTYILEGQNQEDVGYLLLEDGSNLLLEDGGKIELFSGFSYVLEPQY